MAEFYSARGWEIPPLPWTNLSPPFSDRSGQIIGGASPISSAFYAEENLEQLGWILNGHDADGDGSISWDEGEGGLAQIKAHPNT